MAAYCRHGNVKVERRKEVKTMETTLAILMVLGIFVGIPAAIGFGLVGAYIMRERRGHRAQRAEGFVPAHVKTVQ
jgi:hypothetical protein